MVNTCQRASLSTQLRCTCLLCLQLFHQVYVLIYLCGACADASAVLLAAPTPTGETGRTSGPCTRARTSCPITWWTALTTPPSTCGPTTGRAPTSTSAGAAVSSLFRMCPSLLTGCAAVLLPYQQGLSTSTGSVAILYQCWVTLKQDQGQRTEQTGGLQEVAGRPPGGPVVPGQACGH